MVENVGERLIFGDQSTDYIFNLLEDQLSYLGDENELRKRNYGREDASSWKFNSGIYACAIFKISQLLNQLPQVKFHAIDLFDRFMRKHLQDVLNQTKTCYGSHWSSKWPVVLQRLKSQLFLRMCSCVQIASKIRNHDSSVGIGAVLFFLRKCKQSFNKDSVLSSEIRVLQTVNYEIGQKTPLDYMETILEVLARNDPCVNVSVLHDLSVRIVDVVYLEKGLIYERLYQRATGNQDLTSKIEKQNWTLIEEDMIFLIVAILSCAAYILNPCSYVRVVQGLKTIVNIPIDEIMDFTVVLIDFLLER